MDEMSSIKLQAQGISYIILAICRHVVQGMRTTATTLWKIAQANGIYIFSNAWAGRMFTVKFALALSLGLPCTVLHAVVCLCDRMSMLLQ